MVALFVLLIIAANENGCVPVVSKSSVVGVYEMRGDQQKIELTLSADGTFAEVVSLPSGKETRRGKWKWSDNILTFDDLWIPRSFVPTTMQVGFESGSWSVSPTYRWVRVVIDLFPMKTFQS
jgi:hypothetical protein